MTPAEIFTLAQQRDIVVEVDGDRLVVDAPVGDRSFGTCPSLRSGSSFWI